MRNRVSSIRVSKRANFEENSKEISTIRESLQLLGRCQRCNGEGMRVTKKYQRDSESGVIQVVSESELCSLCNGRGSISLSD